MAKPASNETEVIVRTPPRDEVKKHNSAIHVSGELSLIERKLVNVLLLNAYDQLGTAKTHTIPVALLCELVGWEKSGNIAALKRALKTLSSTPIEFDLFNRDGRPTWDTTAIVAHAGIEDGICTYEYSTFLASKLANPETYSMINVGVQREFRGNYSLSLYENCLRFRGANGGSTGWWPIAKWRKVLGATTTLYDEFKFLSGKVIKPAVAEINKVSDLLVEPEYKREGRFVTEIRFIVKENPQRSLLDMTVDTSGARETEAYKLLIEMKVGDSLALSMVQADEERALQLALYTKAKSDAGKISGSAGGYLRRLHEDNVDVSAPVPDKKTGKSAKDQSALFEDAGNTKAAKSVAAKLTEEERAALLAEYIAQSGARYIPESKKFSTALENAGYRSFTISRAKDVIDARVLA